MKRFRRRQEESRAAYEERPPVFVLLASLLLYFVRFGYDYASSDQDEVIPFLLHRMDPGLFTQDWLVSIQVSEFSVRTYFVWLLNTFALIIPVWLTVLILFIVTWLVLAAAVYKLAYHFTQDQVAASGAVVVGLILTPVWTLGGNDLVHSMLVASMVAWALGLWAVYHFLQSRYLIAPVLLGVACWMQPLVGLHLGILLFLLRTIKYARGERGSHTLGGVIAFGLFFALWSSPALGPIIYQQLFTQPPNLNPEPSLFYILAEFRLPHHYMPGSFYLHNVIRFSLLGVLAIGALAWKPFRVRLNDVEFITRVLILIACFCAFVTLFTEFIPVLFIAKLQLFKMTVLAKLLFVIILCGAALNVLPGFIRRALRAVLRRPGWGLTVMTVAWLVVISATVLGEGFFHNRVGPFLRDEQPIGQVQEWVKRNTSYSAIFAVPPSNSSFRSEALRTIVINFKAIPFEDEQMVTWFERLTDMAPVNLPARAGPEFVDELDAAYESLSGSDLVRLSEQYRFRYVLRSSAISPSSPRWRNVFQAGEWIVYERLEEVPPEEEPANEGSGGTGADAGAGGVVTDE